MPRTTPPKKSPPASQPNEAQGAALPDSLASLRDLIAKPQSTHQSQDHSESAGAEIDLGPRHAGLIAIVGRPNVGKSTL